MRTQIFDIVYSEITDLICIIQRHSLATFHHNVLCHRDRLSFY